MVLLMAASGGFNDGWTEEEKKKMEKEMEMVQEKEKERVFGWGCWGLLLDSYITQRSRSLQQPNPTQLNSTTATY